MLDSDIKIIVLVWQAKKYLYPVMERAAYIEWDTGASPTHVMMRIEVLGEPRRTFLVTHNMWKAVFVHLRAWVQGLAHRFPFTPPKPVRYGMTAFGGTIYVPGNAGTKE